MSFSRRRYFRARPAGLVALTAGSVWILLLSCSSDPINTLGSDSDLLESEPGEVYQDTIGVFEDTTYAFNTPIATDTDLELGRASGYRRAMVLQPGFANLAAADVNRNVVSAFLRIVPGNVPGAFAVRFYALGRTYTEGDTISFESLAHGAAIPDTILHTIDRTMESSSALHPLPAAMVQEWIRDSTTREAVAIVYTDNINDRVATYPGQDAIDDKPTLQVNFEGGITRSYSISHDATVYQPTTPTAHLTVSDGYARRVFIRTELDSLEKDSAVHTARIRFHVVPGTLLGTTTTLLLYIPDSTDPADADFKNGQRIIELLVASGDETVEFPLTNALFLILQGTLKNNGFAIRFKDETTELRHIELYGTAAADSLRPQVFVTSSSPAGFN